MRDVLLARCDEIGDKVVRLAEAVPEAAYDVRPAPSVRSFAGQLRDLAFWNGYARDLLRGATPDGAADELPAAAYPDKAAVIGVVRQSFGGVREEGARVLSGPVADPEYDTLVSVLEHAGEHYGQLAVYARLAGVVPPASRRGADQDALAAGSSAAGTAAAAA